MPRPAVVGGAVLACVVVAAMGCTHRRATADVPPEVTVEATPAAALDSLVGIVAVVGTEYEQRLVVRAGTATTSLVAVTADSAALARLGGVEVVVRGWPQGSAFRVAGFVAVRVDGAAVADGVIERDGDGLVLATATGRITLGNPPAAFRTMIGARVWVGGPLETGPNSYGVIVPAP